MWWYVEEWWYFAQEGTSEPDRWMLHQRTGPYPFRWWAQWWVDYRSYLYKREQPTEPMWPWVRFKIVH